MYPKHSASPPCHGVGVLHTQSNDFGLISIEDSRCIVETQVYDSACALCVASLCANVMHEPPNLELHKNSCVCRWCSSCGFDQKFPLCSIHEKGDDGVIIPWSRFEKIEITGSG